ncbi:TIGR02452 family protein [Streptomyces solicathayae]|uniref:TIGR02452 family protein n=1 Tax=Streptomyces solicathayae TaxID=3081768 RepID=A0ABZ0LMU6_9ACTN|nr:TIGR02452 family protein [Streptomyces sp. HUAS YS2]WOX20707.1 TIGR02452 family protein [Streptomyces sp. HUAS YS2]
MSARLRAIARETEEIVEAGRYRGPGGRSVSIEAELTAALEHTTLYGPEPVPVTPDTDRTTRFEVTGESSLAAAHRLTRAGTDPVAVLNFASARNPGGGYLNGAQAQEEAVCRGSALYTTLLRVPEYYEHHRTAKDAFYTDRVILSPGVPVIRDDRDRLLDAPYTVGFLTSPAPNAGVIRRTAPEQAGRIPAVLASRAERVLETAVAGGYRRLVLGAWGCGVFMNSPADVAGTFRALLTGDGRFAGHFDQVVFAILDRGRDRTTVAAFRDVFAAETAGTAETAGIAETAETTDASA